MSSVCGNNIPSKFLPYCAGSVTRRRMLSANVIVPASAATITTAPPSLDAMVAESPVV